MHTLTSTLTGAQLIIKVLNRLGVDTIFGYPGSVVLNMYDELSKQSDIKHYLMRHEQSACHAAEGYAKVSGKCGVVLVTSGPGATNIVTGLANAYYDGTPLIAITGQVSVDSLNKNSFQEVNILDITKSCTKAGFQIKSASDICKKLINAYHIAISERKGPVVVDITKNVFSEISEIFYSDLIFDYDVSESFTQKDIYKFTAYINNSQRPVIIAGQGADSDSVKKLAQKTGIPIVTTMMSDYPVNDDNHIGMIGIFGKPSANKAVIESDLVIAIGTRLNDRATCCFDKKELYSKLIKIDIDKNETINALAGFTGDSKYILDALIPYLSSKNNKDWFEYLKSLQEQAPPQKRSNRLHSFEVMEEIKKYFEDNMPFVTTEVGQHQIWAVKYLKNGKNFVTSGGLGTMGFGFPASIGASIANGNSPIICIAGDGSFQMSMHELSTCVDYKIPVKVFIFNNGYLGMVRQYQEKSCDGRYYATKISSPDFIKLAESYGITGLKIEKFSDIKGVLDKAFSLNAPVLIDCRIEEMELV